MPNNQIALTDRAAEHVRNYLAKTAEGVGLRVGVKPTVAPATSTLSRRRRR